MSYGDVMQIFETGLFDVKMIQPKRHGDSRGWFAETFNAKAFLAAGLPGEFAQDNQSFSARGVLRGLHYQLGRAPGKARPRALRPHLGRRRRPPPRFAGLRQMGRLRPQAAQRRRRNGNALDPGRLRPRLSGAVGYRRSALQNHPRLLSRRRALHPVERSTLAIAWPLDGLTPVGLRQGRRRAWPSPRRSFRNH